MGSDAAKDNLNFVEMFCRDDPSGRLFYSCQLPNASVLYLPHRLLHRFCVRDMACLAPNGLSADVHHARHSGEIIVVDRHRRMR